ncbi:phosphoenolpyruvate carboxykinase [uncultured Bacteroides sp.]|uniref:phosphoenolpyruvate carboxykinase n=1 Tax=uncultured Bacteroides sp. TaxID=162156 RepID=UPI002AAB9BEF|nr:phosphoenolpyruvate carboxykinase [uncultured Bacteroides sp.]
MKEEKDLFGEDTARFCIGGHFIDLCKINVKRLEELLPSFAPFRCAFSEVGEAITSLEVVTSPIVVDCVSSKTLSTISEVLGFSFRLMENADNYIVEIQFVENAPLHRMVCDKCFTSSRAYIDCNDLFAGNVLTSFLMFAFAQSAVLHQTFLIHASAVEKQGEAYAFLGKSGTGKSTHSALWLRYLDGVELLNDDNPAIRIEDDGQIYIYGTPWSGKTPCYKNRKLPLKALVRLEQSLHNSFFRQDGLKAMLTLLPSCSSMRWNSRLYSTLCDLLETVVRQLPIACLQCRPDREAALLCYNEIIKN